MSRALRFVFLTLSVLAAGLAGCASSQPYVWIHQLPVSEGEPYRLQPGDRITVVVQNQTQLSGDFEVRNSGGFLQPLVGEIKVAGMTLGEAAKAIADQLDGIVVDPEVTVVVLAPRVLRIPVLGEVRTPGTYEIPYGEGLITVLARAGGLSEFASDSGVYVLRKMPERVRIRFRYSQIVGGETASIDFKLRDGDVVVVE